MVTAPALDYGGPVAHPYVPFPVDSLLAPVANRFNAICALHAARTAIVDRGVSLSYASLRRRVHCSAGRIDGILGADTRPVAVLMEHAATFPTTMLAVLVSGRGYVPLDPAFPEARNRQILEQAGVSLLLTDAACRDVALVLAGPQLAVHEMDAWPTDPAGAVLERRPGQATDLAYVLFTSGTTAAPKGVFQDQAGLLHDVLQYSNAAHIAPTDRMTLLYSPSVGGATRDIFGALLNGAALHILDPRALGAAGVAQAVRQQRITIYHSVPVVFRRVMASLQPEEHLPDLRLAYLADDRVEPADVAAFRAHTGPPAPVRSPVSLASRPARLEASSNQHGTCSQAVLRRGRSLLIERYRHAGRPASPDGRTPFASHDAAT